MLTRKRGDDANLLIANNKRSNSSYKVREHDQILVKRLTDPADR